MQDADFGIRILDWGKTKKAKLLITIVEEDTCKGPGLSRFKGIFKKKVNGLEYQKKMRGEWN